MAGVPLTFYLNDGSYTSADISSSRASFPTLDTFGWSREGYNFLYWNTASDGSGDTYYADATIPESFLGGGGPFYAIWEAVPTVTYYKTSSTDLTSVADAIRAKGGTSASLVYPNGFVSAIEDISTSGGGNVETATIEITVTNGTATITSGEFPDWFTTENFGSIYGDVTVDCEYGKGASAEYTTKIGACPFIESGWAIVGINYDVEKENPDMPFIAGNYEFTITYIMNGLTDIEYTNGTVTINLIYIPEE